MSETTDRAAKQDIAEVLVRYATGVDTRDWELFRTCFTADCHVDYEGIAVWEDVDAITEYMTDVHADMGHTLHRMSNQAIVVDGDRATARSHVDAVLIAADGRGGLQAIGFYEDDLVRQDDGWRIARRRLTMAHVGAIGGG